MAPDIFGRTLVVTRVYALEYPSIKPDGFGHTRVVTRPYILWSIRVWRLIVSVILVVARLYTPE